jgi:hypothetical protein
VGTHTLHFGGTFDDFAFSLNVSYVIEVIPVMTFSHVGNQLILPAPPPGFVLQENTDLANPAGWRDVPAGNQGQMTVPIEAGNRFFRLRKQ